MMVKNITTSYFKKNGDHKKRKELNLLLSIYSKSEYSVNFIIFDLVRFIIIFIIILYLFVRKIL